MPPRRRIDPAAGRAAVAAWAAGSADRTTLATAVRHTLEELGQRAPGRSVEVRVPPHGAVQCIEGTTHRRGTPPNVVETDPQTWLELATGRLGWRAAADAGRLRVSGTRADVSRYLPLTADPGPVAPDTADPGPAAPDTADPGPVSPSPDEPATHDAPAADPATTET